MYTATVKNVASAKNNAPAIYCESKSGNIYKLKQQVPLQQHARLISQIKSAKVINIQHWIKVKEGTFEESGDREGMLAYLEARTTPEMKAIEARIAQQVAS
jgi:hypothetical protein